LRKNMITNPVLNGMLIGDPAGVIVLN